MRVLEFSLKKMPEDPRLDKAIPLNEPTLSRSLARTLIENGSVYLNKKRCHKNSAVIQLGDKIKIILDPATDQDSYVFQKNQIIYESKDWIVVNKPPGLPTHETIDNSRDHLVLSVKTFLGNREQKNHKDVYLGVHHRLDRDTSGALLFTKLKDANAPIAQAFQNREVEKTYLCIVEGTPKEKKFTVKNFLGTHPRNKRMQAVLTKGGKFAETDFTLIDTVRNNGAVFSLIAASPKTGRTHQIRVHLAHLKLPIVGDQTYGKKSSEFPRTLLHAWKLSLLEKNFQAPIPEDFLSFSFCIEEKK